MTVRILIGDARAALVGLADASVHTVITSPPYYHLRDYQTGTWSGGDAGCSHVVGEMRRGLGLAASPAATRGGAMKCAEVEDIQARALCPHCGAIRVDQQMGLEDTPEAYVAALVGLFREVWRVLRPDGTVFLNLGDSYAGSRMGPQGETGQRADRRFTPERSDCGTGDASWGPEQTPTREAAQPRVSRASRRAVSSRQPPAGSRRSDPSWVCPSCGGSSPDCAPGSAHREVCTCDTAAAASASDIPDMGAEGSASARLTRTSLSPKDLLMMPARVALALQADGWVLRQEIIWAKPNPMPESIRDRCTKAHESIFLLAKQRHYYFDADAIAEPVSPDTHLRVARGGAGSARANGGTRADRPMKAVVSSKTRAAGHRVKNNPDFVNAISGPAIDKRNKRDVWTVGTQPFVGDLCTACGRYYAEGAPRRYRVVDGRRRQVKGCRCGEEDSWVAHFATFPPSLVEPCVLAGCPAGGTVLDPFGGAGTVAVVADRLGRDAILIELNPHYAEMARQRLEGDAGMFADVAAAAE